jgi:tripartite-type tricarboxylate transporter receptor subunit TctC
MMGAALAVPAGQALAQGSRPIEVIVPFPPGGGIDIMARIATKYLPAHLPGASFVVSNRVGAGGQTGTEAVFAARPDGQTIGAIASLALSSIPLERPARWRIEEFTFLANVVDDPGGLWVRADSPLRSLADLKAAMARGAEAVSVGTAAGVGSDDHQLLLAFEEATGLRALHAPYNGTALSIRDLLGGQIDVASYNMSEGLALLREGRTRCLGQAAATRWSAAPEVPTFREQGFDVIGGSARGFAAPPGLPAEIRERYVRAFEAMLADPAFLEEAGRLGLPLRPLTGAAYREAVLAEAGTVRALFERRPWAGR